MRRRILLLTALLAVAAIPLEQVNAQVIFIDPCGITIQPFSTETLRVWVCVEGAIKGGITGGDFRIAGFPEDWLTSVVPTSPVTITNDLTGPGDVFDTNGCAQGVPIIRGMYLELCTIQVTPLSNTTDVLLMPAASNPPQPAPFDCPFVTLCDDPVFTKICCAPHGAYVNPVVFGCALPVETNSWSEIKNLYDGRTTRKVLLTN